MSPAFFGPQVVVLIVLCLACSLTPALGQSTLPEGPGLAARYPGDIGLARDPAVLFAEDFEEGDLAAVARRWEDVNNKNGEVLSLSEDVPPSSSGKHSILMTGNIARNFGGHLYVRIPPVDQAYLRFYTRFAPDFQYEHHFVWLGGHNPSTRWPWPRAGMRPEGNERVSVGIEPSGMNGRCPPPGAWVFYNYWVDMKISADNKYWGNCIRLPEPPQVPVDRWQCVEIMVKLNSAPDQADGELALWLDGKRVMHVYKGVPRALWSGLGFVVVDEGGTPFEGFRWRTDNALKLNYLWLEHYVTEENLRRNKVAVINPISRVWFDDVVVARSYIGPIAPPPEG